MANLVKANIITEVRRHLDEITLLGEVANLDTDLQDLASSNFSDTELGRRADDAARHIAARVRSQFIPTLIETVSASRFHDYNVLRLLGSRVKVTSDDYGQVIATRRTFQGQRKLEARGVPASEEFPVYVFEDWDFRVFPDPVDESASTSATADIVRVPGSAYGATLGSFRDPVAELDERFREAVIQRVLLYCYNSLSLYPLAIEAQKKFSKSIEPYLLNKINLIQAAENASASK
jgi:hypothetical protein